MSIKRRVVLTMYVYVHQLQVVNKNRMLSHLHSSVGGGARHQCVSATALCFAFIYLFVLDTVCLDIEKWQYFVSTIPLPFRFMGKLHMAADSWFRRSLKIVGMIFFIHNSLFLQDGRLCKLLKAFIINCSV